MPLVKIITVVGARPQFIKAAAISRAISERNRRHAAQPLDERIVHTGQHHDHGMSQRFFEELNIPEPAINLGIAGGGHGKMTGAMLSALEHVLIEERPAMVLVYGDTNSTLAAALAASKLRIPVAHVEAGLRSFNKGMPEEINRICTDHVSTMLFCPSMTAVRNLECEGITEGVVNTGDVMADALMLAKQRADQMPELLFNLVGDLTRRPLAVMTIHRAENTDAPEALESVLEAMGQWDGQIVFPIHPRTAKLLEETSLTVPENMHCIPPVGYLEMAALLSACDVVITDSGGLQKEAYWAGRPCITMRNETEWTETVTAGWNMLTGTDTGRIIKALHSAASPPSLHPPLYGGDGNASERIVDSLAKYLFGVE